MSQNIFRKYDIRGIYGLDLTDSIIEKIGKAIAFLISKNSQSSEDNKIVIARDVRISSPKISKILSDSVSEMGVEVLNLGITSTPVFYHYVFKNKIPNGLIVTASHNSKEYNGLKLIINGKSYCLENIQEIYNLVNTNIDSFSENKKNIKEINFANEDYIDDVVAKFSLKKDNFRKFKVVIDSGNSVASIAAPKIFKALGCTVYELYSELDGSFPNHSPDTSNPVNLSDLQNAVLNYNADIGFAYDGDADRLAVVSSAGKIILSDKLLELYSQDILRRVEKAKIIYDVKCTKNLEQIISNFGGTSIMCPTGHSIIKNKLCEIDAHLAGEMSGHFFFAHDWYGFDDAIFASVKLLDILAEKNLNFSETSVSTPEITISYPDSEKASLIERIKNNCEFKNANLVTIDGLRVEYDDCWGLIRSSNTTPNITLRFEGDNQKSLDKIIGLFKSEISKVWPEINSL